VKIPSDQAGSAPPPSRSSESSASDSKAFDNLLERKNAERKAKDNGEKPDGLEDDSNSSAAMGLMPFSPMRDVGPSASAKPADGPKVLDLNGLVQEIMVVAKPGTDPSVEVTFHSSTLEGLNVRVAKKGDDISIRFLTTSNSVAQLLSRSTDQLTQGLASRGLRVAPIQIEVAPAAPGITDSRPASRDGNRGGRGDQRQQGQKK
jgi:hypothetical protein